MIERPRINSEAQPAIEQLARFWPFKRKALASLLGGHISALEQQAGELFEDCAALRAQTARQEQENSRLTQECTTLGEQIRVLEGDLQRQRDQYAQLERRYGEEQARCLETSAQLKDSTEQVAALELVRAHAIDAIRQLKGGLANQKEELAARQKSLNRLGELSARQEQENSRLTQECATLGEQVRALEGDLQRQRDQYAQLERRYGEEQARGLETSAQLKASTEQVAALENLRAEAMDTIRQLEAVMASQTEELESRQQSLDLLGDLAEQLKSSNTNLQADYEQISQKHLSLNERFSLVQRILALEPPPNAGAENFAKLIREDYQHFAARESSLADEAGALLELQQIQRELKMITDFPAISGKTVLGIAGGFSSGKSEFINSFILDRSVQLATGMNPVTVVPSYVVCAPRAHIRGYCANGGSIELGSKLYGALSHEYLEAFGFDLRRIMPSISVQAPMDTELFEHLCLIDTPGYNPGGGSSALSSDRQTATTFVGQCTAMIWVIGLDPAGTITRSDIEFIEQTGLSGKSLYIVLNKADLKSQEDIEAIMAQVAEDLEFDGIEYSGISAYSSTRKHVYACEGLSLEQFIRSHNRHQDVRHGIDAKIDGVFGRYAKAIREDIETLTTRRKQFDALKLDALEIGGTTAFKRLQAACAAIEPTFDPANLQQMLSESESLCLMFRACVRQALASPAQTGAAQAEPA